MSNREVMQQALEQQQAEPVAANRVIECAMRLVEHADFQLGGILSADSKARDIPSNAVSSVKARHLAALRDAIAGTPPQQQAEPISTTVIVLARRAWKMGYEAAKAEQQAEPVGWQPIETAPKDEIVLLGLPLIGNIREGDRRVYEGRWHEAQATWTSVNGFLLLGAATDWMPLPQPPIEAAHNIKEQP